MPRVRHGLQATIDRKDYEILKLRGQINTLEQMCKDFQAKVDALEREKKARNIEAWTRLVEPDNKIKSSATGDLTTGPGPAINRVFK